MNKTLLLAGVLRNISFVASGYFLAKKEVVWLVIFMILATLVAIVFDTMLKEETLKSREEK